MVRIRVRRKKPIPVRHSQYRLSPVSFLASAAFHGGLIALAIAISGRLPTRPVYETEIRPNEKKIIWYDLRKALPDVSSRKIGAAARPRGEIKSPQTMIATSPDGEKSKQLIVQPAPELKLDEIRAPNLVTSVAPPIAPPSPKRFTPPAAAPRPKTPDKPALAAIADVLLQPELNLTAPSLPAPSAIKLPPRRFVPPESHSKEAATTLTAPAAPPALDVANVNAAIVGLNPADRVLASIPMGSRPAQFSAAPNRGKAATGNVTKETASIPNLAINGGQGRAAKPDAAGGTALADPKKTVLYERVIHGPMPGTFSAPLRPGSRRIPSAIEARFHARTVYTIVLPAPDLPEYAGDWVLWFAERQTSPAAATQVQAPLPYRKQVAKAGQVAEVRQDAAAVPETVTRIQLAVIIRKDGALDVLEVLKGPVPAAAQVFVDDLKGWEFHPANRAGGAIDVEAVIDVPFKSNVLAPPEAPLSRIQTELKP